MCLDFLMEKRFDAKWVYPWSVFWVDIASSHYNIYVKPFNKILTPIIK